MKIRYQFISYLWITVILVFIVGGLIIKTWRNRSVYGANDFFLTLIFIIIWIIAQGLEMSAIQLKTKIMWANIQYIPMMLAPITYLYLILKVTRRDCLLKLRCLPILLLIVPIALNALLWTDNLHGLMRQDVHLNFQGGFATVSKTFSPLFRAFAIYNLSLAIFMVMILANVLTEKMSLLYRRQLSFLLIGILLPTLSSSFNLSGFSPFRVDTTPIILGVAALIISWGVFRYRLFDVVPVARSIIIQQMSTGMIVSDNEGRLLDINPAAKKLLNIDSKQIVGISIEVALSNFQELIKIYKEGRNLISEIVFDNDGKREYYEVSSTEIYNSYNKSIGWLLQIYNITERKLSEEMIRHVAYHDALTGLPNRVYFQTLFSQQLCNAKLKGCGLAVAYLDLDDFKFINDTYGHDIGDGFLCEVSKRLKETLGEDNIISRFGGDEYVILIPNVENHHQIDGIGKKILEAFEEKVCVQNISFQIKASIGFSIFPGDGDNIEVLLKKADRAMYRVKDKNKNSYYIYKE